MSGVGCAFDNGWVRLDPLAYQGTRIFRFVGAVRPGWYRTKAVLDLQMPACFRGVDAVSRDGLVRLRNGVLSVAMGWEFDGASGPAIDGVTNLLAALVHDALFLLLEDGAKGGSYRLADWLYREVSKAQGTGWFRRSYHWAGLRCFGWAWRLLGRLKPKGKGES